MPEKILVVDDEAINRELLEAILTGEGYEVALAPDGLTALATVRAMLPDLILLDLLMPGMHGLEVCEHLMQEPVIDQIPVIVVTAVGEITAKETALTRGADDFVTKPIQPDDLRARVRAMLNVRRIRQELDRTLAYLHELEAARREQRRATLAEAAAKEPFPAERESDIAVLLVDDEPLSREFYTDLLAEHGFTVRAAASGREGLALLHQHSVEVALLDIVMPEMSGLEVLQTLQAGDPALPVIMLTSHPTSQNAIAALKLGAFDFIVKGLDHNLVVLTVHRAVRHRRDTREQCLEVERLQSRIRELEARAAVQRV